MTTKFKNVITITLRGFDTQDRATEEGMHLMALAQALYARQVGVLCASEVSAYDTEQHETDADQQIKKIFGDD